MVNERDKMEYAVLMAICDKALPMGCGAISQLLASQGHNISEATIGRMLRSMDHQGFTVKTGFQGRLLSARGKVRAAHLENLLKSRQWGEEFASALRGQTKKHLQEVLVARRAIEGELAYLAAVNPAKGESKVLLEALEAQRQALAIGGGAAAEDADFHAVLSRMARNRVLEAAILLIRQDTQLSPVLEYIRRHVHSLVYIDHQKIAEAVICGRPDEARRAMVGHINNLIKDVEKYWKLIGAQSMGKERG
ncbi:MAG: FCD domain-containing protein [Negativicutes bacterium]|nr:FCD domain-containing protein [Negativicutes bacterium]MDR3591859.1 FCD domain-containing protein [Negativicutes bacterium]